MAPIDPHGPISFAVFDHRLDDECVVCPSKFVLCPPTPMGGTATVNRDLLTPKRGPSEDEK